MFRNVFFFFADNRFERRFFAYCSLRYILNIGDFVSGFLPLAVFPEGSFHRIRVLSASFSSSRRYCGFAGCSSREKNAFDLPAGSRHRRSLFSDIPPIRFPDTPATFSLFHCVLFPLLLPFPLPYSRNCTGLSRAGSCSAIHLPRTELHSHVCTSRAISRCTCTPGFETARTPLLDAFSPHENEVTLKRVKSALRPYLRNNEKIFEQIGDSSVSRAQTIDTD